MEQITFAAGTVDGVYPRPVKADSVLDVLAHDIASPASHVRVSLACGFGESGAYVPATVKGIFGGEISENDFREVGNQCESNRGFGYYDFRVCRRYGFEPVCEIKARNLGALLGGMVGQVTGTVTVAFLSYPDGPKCYPKIEREFKILF